MWNKRCMSLRKGRGNKSSQALSRGPEKYGLTHEEVKSWTYIGGPQGRHYKYWVIKQKGRIDKFNIPKEKKECVCGHPIKENCWITKDFSQTLVVGNCCKQYFLPECGRRCGRCGEPRQNREIDRCNDFKFQCDQFGERHKQLKELLVRRASMSRTTK